MIYSPPSKSDIGLGNVTNDAQLPLAGGTMQGDINSQNILPSTTSSFTLGNSSAYWDKVYTNATWFNQFVSINGSDSARLTIQGASNTGITSLLNLYNPNTGSAAGTGILFSAGASSSSFIGGLGWGRLDASSNTRLAFRVVSNGTLSNSDATAPLYIQGSNTAPVVGMNFNLTMNNKKIVSLSDPTSAQDAATKNYVDTAVGSPSTTNLNTWLSTYITHITSGQAYREPTSTEATNFINGLYQIIHGKTTSSLLTDLGFTITTGYEASSKRPYALIVNEYDTERAWGAYLIDMSQPISMLIEAPHPVYDETTESMALEEWRRVPGALLMISGTHRTDATGTNIRDVAHQAGSLFNKVASEFAQFGIPQIQIHGYADASDADHDVVISSGDSNATAAIKRVAEEAAADGLRVGRNWDGSATSLTGTTNVQGDAALAFGSTFLHIETSNTTRTTPSMLEALYDAITKSGVVETESVAAPLLANAVSGQFPSSVGSANSAGTSPYAARADHIHKLTSNTPSNGQYVKRVSGTWQAVDSSTIATDIGAVLTSSDQTVAGIKTFTSPMVLQAADISGQPGVPQVTADGLWQIKGGDGTKHMIFFPDMDNDGDYDADIYFKNNAYLVASGAFHFRTYDFGTNETGRLVVKGAYNSTSGLYTNYIQTAVNYSGTTPADLAITDYNSDFRWLLFDQSQNGYAGFGLSGDDTPDSALARIHAKDGAATVALFEGTNVAGTARIAFKDVTTSSGSAVTVGAFGDYMILRAESTNSGRLTGTGLYVGGNVTPTAVLHIAASTTSRASLRIVSGVAPTSPNSGDVWNESGVIKLYDGTTTQTVAYQSYALAKSNNLSDLASASTARTNLGLGTLATLNTVTLTTNVTGILPIANGGTGSSTQNFVDLTTDQSIAGVKKFMPTNSTTAFQVTKQDGTTNTLLVDTTNNRVLVGTGTGAGSAFNVNGKAFFGGSGGVASAYVEITGSTTTGASLRIRSGTAPTTPNDGDMWYDGTHLYGQVAGATLQLDNPAVLAIAQGGTGSSTQNFVDLSTAQTISGTKTFSGTLSSTNTFTTTGAVRSAPTTRTGAVTLTTTSSEFNLCDSTSGAFTVTLPSTTTAGYIFRFIKTDSSANAITIAGTINGVSNYTLSAQYKYVYLISTSVSGSWLIIDSN